jgi:hypothetical protein
VLEPEPPATTEYDNEVPRLAEPEAGTPKYTVYVTEVPRPAVPLIDGRFCIATLAYTPRLTVALRRKGPYTVSRLVCSVNRYFTV